MLTVEVPASTPWTRAKRATGDDTGSRRSRSPTCSPTVCPGASTSVPGNPTPAGTYAAAGGKCRTTGTASTSVPADQDPGQADSTTTAWVVPLPGCQTRSPPTRQRAGSRIRTGHPDDLATASPVVEERPYRRRQLRVDGCAGAAKVLGQGEIAAEHRGVLGRVLDRDRQVERALLRVAHEPGHVEPDRLVGRRQGRVAIDPGETSPERQRRQRGGHRLGSFAVSAAGLDGALTRW